MTEYIEIRGKRYPVVDDVEYVYAKRFRKLQKQNIAGALEDPDEALIELLAEAVCPKLKLDKENMSVDGKNLTFGEVKKLVMDLRDAFESILNEQLDLLLDKTTDKGIATEAEKEAKNSGRATEG
jgi:hypothetical protein